MRSLALLFVLGFSVVAAPAAAQRAEVPAVCREDIQKLCAGMTGGTRILECLTTNAGQLSERCLTMLTAAPAEPERDYKACQGEVQLLCKDIEPGEGRIRECLRTHAMELSAACRVYQKRIKD